MVKLRDIINNECKSFESYPIQFIDDNEHEENITNDTFINILRELCKINNSKYSKLFYEDDLRDVIMYLSNVYIENKLSLEERLELLKIMDINKYNDIMINFNNELFMKMINYDDDRKHDILNLYNISCFRNV